jgi:hypothetical protein
MRHPCRKLLRHATLYAVPHLAGKLHLMQGGYREARKADIGHIWPYAHPKAGRLEGSDIGGQREVIDE